MQTISMRQQNIKSKTYIKTYWWICYLHISSKIRSINTFWEIPGEYMDDGDEHPPRNIFDATKMIPMAGKINKQVLNKSIEWSCIFYSKSIH